jgi:DNA replication protein DnaC
MTEKTTLVLSGQNQDNKNCLGLYLLADKKRTKVNLPGNHAEKDSMVFEASLEKLQSKLQIFLNSPDKQRSILVLGKIQSGKTAHMLGTLAWAVNQKIMFAVVFTGINGDLNDQTQARLKSNLVKALLQFRNLIFFGNQ